MAEMIADLPCHVCGYDLRAHPLDAKCPECGASVADAQRAAAIPRRPAWRDSDPRWRRRMLAGVWILVLLPLMDVLRISGWVSSLRVPTLFDYRGTVRTLDETLLSYWKIYASMTFCIGVVLLFSKERGRRRNRLDWTRRWGVLCTYMVFLISVAEVLFITSLVSAGIAAVFHSMPLKYQPDVTPVLATFSWAYLGYGAQPMDRGGAVCIAFSSLTVLLACFPLFDALRSSGPRRYATTLLTPLALFSLFQLARAGRYCLPSAGALPTNLYHYEIFFWSDPVAVFMKSLSAGLDIFSGSFLPAALAEVAKWCIVLAIAVWLTIAQIAAVTRRSKPPAAGTDAAARANS